jgi:hypothetical protein
MGSIVRRVFSAPRRLVMLRRRENRWTSRWRNTRLGIVALIRFLYGSSFEIFFGTEDFDTGAQATHDELVG